MHEALRQLTLALALPIAVSVVWAARGNPAQDPAQEFATAYRVALADLPLPTRERLRAPGEGTRWRISRVPPEDPTARARRPALATFSEPPPVDLADVAASGIEISAPPSRRASVEPLDVASGSALPVAVPDAPALVAAAPLAVSHRPRPAPASAASVEPAPARREPGATGVVAVEPAAETRARMPASPEPAIAAFRNSSTPTRASTPTPAPGLSGRDLETVRSRGRQSPLDDHSPVGNPSPIVTSLVEIDESPLENFATTDDRAPLTPAGPANDHAFDLSLASDSHDSAESPVQLIDLPLQALEHAAASKFVDLREETSETVTGFQWLVTPSKTLHVIPEPGSALLLGAALAALGAARRRAAGARSP